MTGAASWRVLVTRPEPGLSATARRLASAGFEPVMLPLSETGPLPADPPAAVIDAVAATSAQALRWAGPRLTAALRNKPFLAVGGRTGSAARAAGFTQVSEAAGDAAALAALVLARPGISSLLYLCGRVRRPDFEAALTAAGVSVHAVETYDATATVPPPEQLAAVLGRTPPRFVLLYSVLAAQAYGRLLRMPGTPPQLRDAVPLALSPRILSALPAGAQGFAAAEPNEEALFALLAERRRVAAPFQPLRV